MTIKLHEHLWVPWDAFRTTVCDEIECGAARSWSDGILYDRHLDDRMQPWGVVTEYDLTRLREIVLTVNGTHQDDSWAGSAITSMDDEFGWTSSGGPVLQWEEGPEEWSYEFAEVPATKSYLASRGLRIEPVKSWIVGVYPA